MLSRRSCPLGLLLVCSAGTLTAWAQSAQRLQAMELVKEASTAFSKGEMGLVVKICRQAIQVDPTYPRAYVWVAAAYQRRGDRPNACSAFNKVIRLAPNTPDAQRAARGQRELGCTVASFSGPRPPAAPQNTRMERRWTAPTGITGVAFSPDSQFLAGVGIDGSWRLWRTGDGELDQTQTARDSGEAGGVAASNDFYAAGSSTGNIRLFDARDGRRAGQLDGSFGPVYALAYSRDGRYLAAAGSDRSLKLYESPENRLLNRIQDPRLPVLSVAFSPDARFVAATFGSEVRIYGTQRGNWVRTLRGDGLPMGPIAWSRTGNLLAAGNQAKIRVWNPNNGQAIRVLQGHSLSVTSLSFGLGSTLASSAYDGRVRLWNASTGAGLGNLALHYPVRTFIAFDSSGKRLASGDQNGQMGLWRLP